MNDWIPQEILDFFTPPSLIRFGQTVAIAFVSYLLLRLVVLILGKVIGRRMSDQSTMVLRKLVTYLGLAIIILVVLGRLGASLGTLLGAAGVVGIALGFAAQTSVSNIISGVFLISEKSFAVGEVIKIGDKVGIVQSIDLLSVKLRTFDNQLIRVPNETLIKTELTNVTRFPIRRLDVRLRVAHGTDLTKTRELLMDIAAKNPCCLDDPEPLFILLELDNLGVEVLFGVWFAKDDFLKTKNSVLESISTTLQAAGIVIPVLTAAPMAGLAGAAALGHAAPGIPPGVPGSTDPAP